VVTNTADVNVNVKYDFEEMEKSAEDVEDGPINQVIVAFIRKPLHMDLSPM
jgi:hypothetical protein